MRGVGVFETTNFAGINGVSMAGGGVVTIAGWGLSETPKKNQVMFTTGDVSPSPITLTGTPLTQNDEFNSRTADGKLTYSLPSMNALFGVPVEQFEPFTVVSFKISVVNTETGDTHVCSDVAKCTVNYHWNNTPRLLSLIPPIVYKGMKQCVLIQPRNAPSYYDANKE